MRLAVGLLFLGFMSLASSLPVTAQISQPVISVQLDGEPRSTQVPPYSILGSRQCDGSGLLYLRYASPAGGTYSSVIAKVDEDGNTETVSLGNLPGASADRHSFVFVAAEDGSFDEILRAGDSEQDKDSQIDYVRFDPDGAVRSDAAFAQEFVPSTLVPLPNGNFFATGSVLREESGEVVETSLAGIFNSDAKLQRKVKWDAGTAAAKGKKQDSQDESEEELLGQTARLGGDGNIYLLLDGDRAEVAVITQSGRIARVLHLKQPFENGVVSDMWVSGNRLLVAYEGETDDPRDAFLYVMYDAQTGDVIRAYHPDFTGTPACFEDGQTLSVLVRQPASGRVGIGTVALP